MSGFLSGLQNNGMSMMNNSGMSMMNNSGMPSTNTLNAGILNLIAGFNKTNYNYSPEMRNTAIQQEISKISSMGNLGNYTVSGALGNSLRQGVASANNLYANTKKSNSWFSGGKTRKRGGKGKGRGRKGRKH